MPIKLKGRRMQYQVSRCPFCTARVYVHEVKSERDTRTRWRIQCGKCGCSLPTAFRLPELLIRWFKSARLELEERRDGSART